MVLFKEILLMVVRLSKLNTDELIVSFSYSLKRVEKIKNIDGDFCDLDNKNNEWFLPAKELRMDLIEEKYFRDTVKIYPSISSFNRNVIHRKIDHIEKIQNNKNINKYIINLVSIELDKFDVLEVYNNCQKEKSMFIKVYEAKVVEGYNYYGNSSDEVILLVQIELLCKSLNKSANYFKTITKAQIFKYKTNTLVIILNLKEYFKFLTC